MVGFGPGRPSFPGLTRKLVVDTFRGRVRVRKWPEKRGRPKSDQVRIQNERFADAQRLAKRAPGLIQAQMIKATKNTGLYPRDLLTKFILKPPFELELPDGRVIKHGRRQLFTVEWQGFINRLQADQGIPAGNTFDIPWPLPQLDTAGFWDAGSPTVVTIPPGVEIMEFFAGLQGFSFVATRFVVNLRRIAPTPLNQAVIQMQNGWGATVATGPILVQPGETYALTVFSDVAQTMFAEGCFFGGTILKATV